jgi:hypothetical protein
MTAKGKKDVRRIIYRSDLALKSLDTAVGISNNSRDYLDAEIEARLRDARLCIISALLIIKEKFPSMDIGNRS